MGMGMGQGQGKGMGKIKDKGDGKKQWETEKWKGQGWQDWGYDEGEIKILKEKKQEAWSKVTGAVAQALMPVAHLEQEWSGPDFQKRMCTYIQKQMQKLEKDERLDTFGSPGAMINEFVGQIMGTLQAACYERPWFGQVDFTGPLYAASIILFKHRKLFDRTTGARLQVWIVDAFNRWNEEQRVERVMWETVQALGVNEKYSKELNKALMQAYDEAHAETTFIVPESANPEIVMLQEFIAYWYKDFVFRAWDTLSWAKKGRESQKQLTVALFQSLCSPEVKCLPHDLTSSMDAERLILCWSATADKIELLFQQAETAQSMRPKPVKKPKLEDPFAAASAAAATITASLAAPPVPALPRILQ